SARRPATTTRYPPAASARLTARPIPLPPPVTSATRSHFSVASFAIRSFAISMTVASQTARELLLSWFQPLGKGGGSGGGTPRKIGMLGAGSVGGALGKRLAQAGHDVRFGVRNPASEEITRLLAECADHASAGEAQTAIETAEVVVCALPWGAAQQALTA